MEGGKGRKGGKGKKGKVRRSGLVGTIEEWKLNISRRFYRDILIL